MMIVVIVGMRGKDESRTTRQAGFDINMYIHTYNTKSSRTWARRGGGGGRRTNQRSDGENARAGMVEGTGKGRRLDKYTHTKPG